MSLNPQETFSELVDQNNAYREQIVALQSELARQRETTLTPEEAQLLLDNQYEGGALEPEEKDAIAKLRSIAASPSQSAPEETSK